MTMRSLSDIVVFDLDDTLYKEVSFVRSGFAAVAAHIGKNTFADDLMAYWREGKNAFEELINRYSLGFSKSELLEVYRHHSPEIALNSATESVLDALIAGGKILGLITDGRTVTQQNKIKALRLYRWIDKDNIVISESFGSAKPDERNYRYFMSKHPARTYTYIGDNTGKDFVTPKILGWQTICVKDNGQNIHPQDFELEESFLPDITIDCILELKNLI